MIGEVVSHFKIVGQLGEGGMGVVYRGVDTDLDRPVAIKVLSPEGQRNEESVARFLREAKTASRLQHAGITTIYEFGVKDDLRYLVMEFIDGKTLRELLKDGALPTEKTLDIGIQIADALMFAGEKGVIHRDIKAENIMLTHRGQVKILDFGLAKMFEANEAVSGDTFKTIEGRVVGTVKYMSPEQALGAELDPRSDIFSTGVVMYEMATGASPFSGTSPSVVMAKILNQPPPPLSQHNANVPPALEKAILKCLQKNRDDRYQKASELLADLRSAKQEFEKMRIFGVAAQTKPPATAPRPPSEQVESLRALIPGDSGEMAAAVAPPVEAKAEPRKPSPSPGKPGGQAAEARTISAFSKAWRKATGISVSMFRKAVIVAGSLYAVGCVVLFFQPLLRTENMGKVAILLQWLHVIIDPPLKFFSGIITINPSFHEYNFLLIAMAIAIWTLQLFVAGRLEWVTVQVYKPLKQAAGATVVNYGAGAAAPQGTRMSLLRDYAASKRLLNEVKKDLAFLSVDVVGSTKMKIGEDKISIEHAFAEYKKFLERIFRDCRCWRVAWTPDGVMACFLSPEDAAAAGRKVLTELGWFNRDVHQLRTPFSVRCGLSAGEVMFPEDKPLEDISDEIIDVAGHMQKYAEPDTMWISGDVYQRLVDRSGYERLDKQVDNRTVYEWKIILSNSQFR